MVLVGAEIEDYRAVNDGDRRGFLRSCGHDTFYRLASSFVKSLNCLKKTKNSLILMMYSLA